MDYYRCDGPLTPAGPIAFILGPKQLIMNELSLGAHAGLSLKAPNVQWTSQF